VPNWIETSTGCINARMRSSGRVLWRESKGRALVRARAGRVKVHFVIYHGPSSSISGIATGSTFIYKGRGELYSGAAACWIIQFRPGRLFLSLTHSFHATFAPAKGRHPNPPAIQLDADFARIFTARVMINIKQCALTHTNLFFWCTET